MLSKNDLALIDKKIKENTLLPVTFSEELDKVLSVLEAHGYNSPCEIGRVYDTENKVFNVYNVNLHDVLEYVSAYCQKQHEVYGYIQYGKNK